MGKPLPYPAVTIRKGYLRRRSILRRIRCSQLKDGELSAADVEIAGEFAERDVQRYLAERARKALRSKPTWLPLGGSDTSEAWRAPKD